MNTQKWINAGLCLLMTGCLQELADPEADTSGGTVTLSGFSSALSATPSQAALISGQVDASGGLDSLIIQAVSPRGTLMVRGKADVAGKKSYALKDYPFNVSATACNGAYSAVITAYAGAKTATHTLTVNVSGAATCSDGVNPDPVGGDNVSVTANLSLGAQGNATLGSSIDLDAPEVMLARTASQNSARVDLVYLNSFATDSDKLGSPAWAQDNVTFMSGWSVYNSTAFHKVTATASFAGIKTRTQLAALWNPALVTTNSVDVKPGDLVIAKTDQGIYALIEISGQVPGETGNIKIKVAK